MSDFSYQKKIERFYSYSTSIKPNNQLFESFININSNKNSENNPLNSVLFSKLEIQSSRFLEGFYSIENRNNRWMSRVGKVLLNASSKAKFFFIKGYFPDDFHPNNKLEVTVYFDETLIKTITISKIVDYTAVIPVDKYLVINPGSAILVKLIVNNTVIPAKGGLNCTDNRELSMLVDSLGFIDSENVSKEIDKHYKRCTLISQPLVPYFKGFCNVCSSEEYFALENLSMIRETFRCNKCGSSNRTRQLSRGLITHFQNIGFTSNYVKDLANELIDSKFKIYDTDSNYFIASLLQKYDGYITSDFLDGVESGTKLSENHYCQDLSKLTFESNSFDVVLSTDVFEHVRLYQNAISEIYRVLKPGGVYLFTVPFKSELDDHETFIDVIQQDEILKDVELRQRVYHGDTISNEGALLYRIYGKKLFKEFEDAGFFIKYERSTIPESGIFDCDLFTAYKPQQNYTLLESASTDLKLQNHSNKEIKHNKCILLNIEFSSVCNLRCKWCILDHSKPKEFLSPSELKKIMIQIQDGQLPFLERIELHNGGETLLHPKIDEALEIIKEAKKNFTKPIFITLLTNGTVLKESTLNLLSSGDVVDEIRISIDGGSKKEFEEIRKNAKWEKVAANVNRFRDSINKAKSNTKLGIICMVPLDKPDNIEWMEEEFRNVLELTDNIEIRYPHSWEGSLPESSGIQSKASQKRADRLCKFLKNDMVVLASGNVTVCCADLNGRGIIGDVSLNSLDKIFAGDERQKIITLWQEGRFEDIPLCSTCEGYYDAEPVLDSKSEEHIVNSNNINNVKSKNEKLISETLQQLNSKLSAKSFFEVEKILSRTKTNITNSDVIQEFKKSFYEAREIFRNEKKWNSKISAQKLIEAEQNIEINKLDRSESLLFEILNVEPTHIEAANNLAVVYILKEDYQNAFDLILYILNKDHENEVALGNLEYLKSIVDVSELLNVSGSSNHNYTPVEAPDITINQFRTLDDFKSFTHIMKSEFKGRIIYEKNLLDGGNEFTINGYCSACKANVDFIVDYNYAYEENGTKIPNWRERLLCPNCNLNNRTRAALHLIDNFIKPDSSSKIFLTEQTTPLYQYTKSHFPNTVGSEYIGDKIEFGTINDNGIRNEDLTNLTFENAEFDLVLSFEVFEHIPDFKRAFSEVLRILKPGGKLLFTVPFNRNSESNLVRAIIQDDQIQHICSPEYHGDPINESEGCLCFYHFSWELLDQLKSEGFEDAYCCSFYSKEAGHLGDEQFFIIAEKKK
ncbi:MAG: methyltransferase domain-containing protein [Ignavibacteriales bacterium]|nr:methyltransferase domain-containing protein [Ignavibacteriales bacterium]